MLTDALRADLVLAAPPSWGLGSAVTPGVSTGLPRASCPREQLPRNPGGSAGGPQRSLHCEKLPLPSTAARQPDPRERATASVLSCPRRMWLPAGDTAELAVPAPEDLTENALLSCQRTAWPWDPEHATASHISEQEAVPKDCPVCLGHVVLPLFLA